VSNRDVFVREFDPSSFDDVLELVGTWTRHESMTVSQIVDGLRARGVLVRATSSGRHVIVESPQRNPGDPPVARRFAVPNDGQSVGGWAEHRVDLPVGRPADLPADRPVGAELSHRRSTVLRPPGQALHRIAGLFSKRTRERILEPIIADMQLEYCDTLAEERPSKGKLWLVHARAWIAFAEAIVLRTVVGRLIKGLSKLV
jgi:hypothetical protein